jgi:anthranilate synthase/phosphoribosyltransferase
MTGVLIIDNFDSFVYNLYQYVGELGFKEVKVLRNNVSLPEIVRTDPERLIISPGPGRPEDAGVSIEVIQRFSGKIPILGVCLGHQAIGAAFGAEIVRAERLLHGKTSMIEHNGKSIFQGVKNPFIATRYHSLIIDSDTLPSELEINAKTVDDGTFMGVRHKTHPTFGVQFHPESILTAEGKKIVKNFLQI